MVTNTPLYSRAISVCLTSKAMVLRPCGPQPLSPTRTPACPEGNLLTDASVCELVRLMVTSKSAPNLQELDLSANASLTWRCCQPLGQLLSSVMVWPPPGPKEGANSSGGGGSGGAEGGDGGAAAAAGVHAWANPVELRVLRLEGVQIGDKGATLLAEPLARSETLQVGLDAVG